jgi:sialate O-acetylesterase
LAAFTITLLLMQTSASYAELKLATLFRDGAVLQRDKTVVVWGIANPDERIKVEFKGQSKLTSAGDDGRWLIRLDPLKASAEPAELTICGENTVSIKGVLVGDVWLCSGQSNMNLPLAETNDAKEEIAHADHPLIHYFEVKSSILEEPADYVEGTWQVCAPEVARGFTAVGYYFADAIQPELGVPIGIIKATLGGSPIEGWIAADALNSTPASVPAFEAWQGMKSGYEQRANEYREQLSDWKSRSAAARAAGEKYAGTKPVRAWVDSDRNKPSGLYNGFIYPLEPFTLAGVLWYQGEGNVPRPAEYKALFPLMIEQWRRDFQQAGLPFIFVQLPNYAPTDDRSGESWPRLREAQAAALSLPNVGMAVTTDIGDPVDLHPGNKRDVGRRLALIALRMVYDRSVEDSGPKMTAVTYDGTSARIRFANAKGLRIQGDPKGVFLLAGPDRNFVPADARIDGGSVVVSANGVDRPVAIRLNWENNPQGVLLNEAGLPAAPFRTDDW